MFLENVIFSLNEAIRTYDPVYVRKKLHSSHPMHTVCILVLHTIAPAPAVAGWVFMRRFRLFLLQNFHLSCYHLEFPRLLERAMFRTIFTIFVVCVASKLVNIFAYLQKFAKSFMGLWHFNTKYSIELLSWNLVPDRVGFRCREQIRCRYTLVWNF